MNALIATKETLNNREKTSYSEYILDDILSAKTFSLLLGNANSSLIIIMFFEKRQNYILSSTHKLLWYRFFCFYSIRYI